MPPPTPAQPLSGSLRIFQFSGINVYVHWSWLIVAIVEVQYRANNYASQVWNVIDARLLARLEGIPDDAVARCPNCSAIPPPASLAECPNCSTRFSPFATRGSCPKCGAMFGTVCPSCGQQSMLIDWFRPANRR